MNRVKLQPGRFVADEELCLSLFQGEMQKDERTVKAGEEFEIPRCVNGHGYYAVYFPDFGDEEPKFHQL